MSQLRKAANATHVQVGIDSKYKVPVLFLDVKKIGVKKVYLL